MIQMKNQLKKSTEVLRKNYNLELLKKKIKEEKRRKNQLSKSRKSENRKSQNQRKKKIILML